MVEINLLPWRETKRIVDNRRFIGFLSLCLAIGALLLLGVFWHFQSQVVQQRMNNQYLSDSIQKLAFKIAQIARLSQERDKLLEKNRAIESLFLERLYIVDFFNSIPENLPDSIAMFQITREGEKVVFVGEAQNNSAISVFMDQLDNLPWFSNAVLSEIKTETLKPQFVLQVAYHLPKEDL